MRRLLVGWSLLVGCSAPASVTPEPAPLSPTDPLPTAVATNTAAPLPGPAPTASAQPDSGPKACPDDMLLVDGDYCQNLEMTCVSKFEAPQNNLWVCEAYKEPTTCRGATTPMRYCIDKYEYPNKKGVRPMVMQNFYQAQVHCHKRGKRVCTETEWTKACEGPDNKPFPYGYVRDARKCNGDHPWDHPNKEKFIKRDPVEIERLWKGVLSGSHPNCISDYGVHDMPANADELAASETYGKGPKSDFDNVTTGGPWYHGVRNACRPKIYSHDESFAYYYLSWRCCAEADGKPTDPRSPKQIKRGDSWDKVVRLANNSWNMPLNDKEPGDEGYSAAGRDRKPVPPKD